VLERSRRAVDGAGLQRCVVRVGQLAEDERIHHLAARLCAVEQLTGNVDLARVGAHRNRRGRADQVGLRDRVGLLLRGHRAARRERRDADGVADGRQRQLGEGLHDNAPVAADLFVQLAEVDGRHEFATRRVGGRHVARLGLVPADALGGLVVAGAVDEVAVEGVPRVGAVRLGLVADLDARGLDDLGHDDRGGLRAGLADLLQAVDNASAALHLGVSRGAALLEGGDVGVLTRVGEGRDGLLELVERGGVRLARFSQLVHFRVSCFRWVSRACQYVALLLGSASRISSGDIPPTSSGATSVAPANAGKRPA